METASAAAEKRFTRCKHTGAFPNLAIRACLRQAGLRIEDIDEIAHGFDYRPYKEMYSIDPFPGRMALIRCREKSFFDGPDDYLGWGGLAEGGIDVFDAPGDHHTLMSEPNVGELGRILCRCLHSAV